MRAVLLVLLAGCGGSDPAPSAPGPSAPPPATASHTDVSALADLSLALPPAGLRARSVAVGGSHACVIALDGEVRCWGHEERLGGGTPAGPGIPIAVPGLEGVVELDAGLAHTAARTTSGEVFVWGGADVGEIGDGSLLHRVAPTRTPIDGATAIEATGTGTCVAVEGDTRCWGWLPSPVDGSAPSPVTFPARLGLSGRAPLHVVVDSGSSAAFIFQDGTVRAWGRPPRLGLEAASPEPIDVVPLPAIASDLVGSPSLYCASLPSGAWCWGTTRYHLFGGPSDHPETPAQVTGIPGGAALAAGEKFLCGLASGEVWCAGWGQLVDASGGIWELDHTATRIGALDGLDSIDAGSVTVCGTASESVRCLGWRSGIEVPIPPS